jgi:DNA-binding CsgD family transcriptional regulator
VTPSAASRRCCDLPSQEEAAPGASALTGAEFRLLPMLSAHLSFAGIAAEMFLSRNTS